MGERLRVGVIGTGFGARVHLPAFRLLPETEVVAVCSGRLDRARAVAAEFGVPLATDDYRHLLAAPGLEAVSIAAPPHLHHPMAMAALLAGKHVLCEKPMARTVAEARDMLRQAQAAGVAHMVAHEFRFLPARRRLKALIDEGLLGELRTVSLTVFRDSLADPHGRPHGWLSERDQGGGMLGAVGSHAVDGLLWWFGPIVGVTGRLATTVRTRRGGDGGPPRAATADDVCAFVVEFAGGALGTVHIGGTSWHGSGEHLEAYGSAGTLVLTADGTLLAGRRGERQLRPVPIDEPPDEPPAPAGASPLLPAFLRLARTFAAAARDGQPRPPTFADGLRVQEVLGGVQKAARDGQWAAIGRETRLASGPPPRA